MIRHKLISLAENIFEYHRRIEDAGFSSCFVREKWYEKSCSKKDFECHRLYLKEYASEAISVASKEAIIFDDNYVCSSQFLRKLKVQRYLRYGPIESILKNPETAHLSELSPCSREFFRMRQSRDELSRRISENLHTDFLSQKEVEILSTPGVDILLRSLPKDLHERSLQSFWVRHMYLTISRLGDFYEIDTPGMFGGMLRAITFRMTDDIVLLIRPSVSSELFEGNPEGSMGVGFFLAEEKKLQTCENHQMLGLDNLNLTVVFPDEFDSYGFFGSAREFCLNVLAFCSAIKIIMPDIIRRASM